MHPSQSDILLPVLTSLTVLFLMLLFFVVTILRFAAREKKSGIRLRENIVALEESLKKKLSAELHDEFGAALAAITLKLQCIVTSDKNILENIRGIENYIRTLTPRLRSISYNLMPPQLERYGLKAAIINLVNEIGHPGEPAAHVHIGVHNLQHEQNLHIFRIVQELFTNILKHSKAKSCAIQLIKTGKKLKLTVYDDGIGLDEKKYRQAPSGIGLINVFSRVELLNGTMYLTSEPGAGTEYLIEIPCFNERKQASS